MFFGTVLFILAPSDSANQSWDASYRTALVGQDFFGPMYDWYWQMTGAEWDRQGKSYHVAVARWRRLTPTYRAREQERSQKRDRSKRDHSKRKRLQDHGAENSGAGEFEKQALQQFMLAPLSSRRDIAMMALIHRTVLGKGPPHFSTFFRLSAGPQNAPRA